MIIVEVVPGYNLSPVLFYPDHYSLDTDYLQTNNQEHTTRGHIASKCLFLPNREMFLLIKRVFQTEINQPFQQKANILSCFAF
jgi:hypothetical protein